MIAEAYQVLEAEDAGQSSRRYNNLVGKFNQFLNHSEFERKTPEKIINGNQNLNQLVQSFMERENWNGPRKDNPVTWPAWLRALARAILAEAEQIQFVQIEQATAVTQGESYEYDDAGSMSRSHKYEGGVESSAADYVNNDDSRLAAIEGPDVMFGDYVYDHLGQRVLKSDLGLIIFVYDVFGNMIGEYYTDHSFRNEFIYLGGSRLAMVANQAGGGNGGGFPGCNTPPPIEICGVGGMGEGIALNWILLAGKSLNIFSDSTWITRPVYFLLRCSTMVLAAMETARGFQWVSSGR